MPENIITQSPGRSYSRWLLLAALPVLLHLVVLAPAEPVYNGDANRHVMTSVFFHDFLLDLPLSNPKQYAEDYYEQYPALGLMIWPPLFHGVVGLLMTVFGTSVLVARFYVFACFVLAAFSLLKLCRRRMPIEQAEFVVAVFAVLPMIFEYSRYVMLEMQTLAFCLVCIERFDIWLKERRTRNLYIAAVFAALASLTRFDAAVLLPTLLLMAVFEKNWRQLFSWHVVGAALVAIIVLGPTYAVIWREMGQLHLRQATESVSGRGDEAASWASWNYYPIAVPDQAGWVATAMLCVGLLAAFQRKHRATAAVFFAMFIATYVTFTPLAELQPRHAIYWLPAIAYFSVVGAMQFAELPGGLWPQRSESVKRIVFSILVCGTAASTWFLDSYRVTGYARACDVALQHTNAGESIFIDGWWDGNLTYHIRHLDKSRSRHVVRADRVLFDFTNVPTVDFQSLVDSDAEILQAILDSKATCVVFEDPQPFGDIAISHRMHELLKSLPNQFPLIETVPVSLRFPNARPFDLKVFSVNASELHTYLNQQNSGPEAASVAIDGAVFGRSVTSQK
ncbi:MAG: glycosyltransferase family 39 protein [Fuerstiella sp.]